MSPDRHLIRHKQKDEEAGGVGLGVVETRKRLWRDADGNIVHKRPSLTNQLPRTQESLCINNSDQCDKSTGEDGRVIQVTISPTRPPFSSETQGRALNHLSNLQVAEEQSLAAAVDDVDSDIFGLLTSSTRALGHSGSMKNTQIPEFYELGTLDVGELLPTDC